MSRMAFAVLPEPKRDAAVWRLTSDSPKSLSPVLQRKCAGSGHRMGGCECEDCSRKPSDLQTEFKVSQPGDIYEQEADRVADRVMNSPAQSAVMGTMPHVQRSATTPGSQMNAAPASISGVLSGPSQSIEPSLRSDMEQRFSFDFSRVRVHIGTEAEESARELNAAAYTVGQHIVFGAGRFAPRTHEGLGLIAHELAHVVQQSDGTGAASGLLQRQPVSTQTQADYEAKVKKKTWCRDSEKSGALHDPNQQCYRELMLNKPDEEAGQVCFDKKTGKFADNSPDFVSAVSGINADGTCDIPLGITDPPNPFSKRGRRALGHGIADVCSEDPRMCGKFFGGISGVAMGIALPKGDLNFLGKLAIPAILGYFGEKLAGGGMERLDKLARRHGFLPTLSLGLGSNIGLSVGAGFEKRDRPLPLVPVNTYLTFEFDSSLAASGDSAFLAKVGVRIDPGKQGGIFALSSIGAGLSMGESNVSGTISADVGVGIRATDFLDVQVVHETLVGGERGGTYWLTLKLVAPRRVLEGHKK